MNTNAARRRTVTAVAGLIGLALVGAIPAARAQCRSETFRARAALLGLRRADGSTGRADAGARAVLGRRRDRLAECYRNLLALHAVGRENGELRVRFAVGDDGRVAGTPSATWTPGADAARPPEDDGVETEQRIGACAVSALRDLRFARAAAGVAYEATVRLEHQYAPAPPCGGGPASY